MKSWVRLGWLLVSGAWFIRLQMAPVLMWARWPLSKPPQRFTLWAHVLVDWSHSWLLFVTIIVLALGFVLEAGKKKAAGWLNVGFYAAYVLMLCVEALIGFFQHRLEPEAVFYLLRFGESAMIILVIDYLFYRGSEGAKSRQHGQTTGFDCDGQ